MVLLADYFKGWHNKHYFAWRLFNWWSSFSVIVLVLTSIWLCTQAKTTRLVAILVSFWLSLGTKLLPLFSVCQDIFSCLRALSILTPGVTAHISMSIALLAAPVLNIATVSDTAMQTLLAPQNFVLGHLDHQISLAASFWFCVIPFRHLVRRSSFDNLVKIWSSSFIKTPGKRLSSLYNNVPFILSFWYLHHVSLDLGQSWCCYFCCVLSSFIIWCWVAFMLLFIPSKFPLFPLISFP